MARFEHEARVLASLNHPHIAAVYGIEKGAAFEHGIPAPLFNVQTAGYFPYDIGPDGRFLINVPIERNQPAPNPINVVVDWSGTLPR